MGPWLDRFYLFFLLIKRLANAAYIGLCKHNMKCGMLLSSSTHNHLVTPILAGINITAFTTTLLEQRRLDSCLYDAIVKHMPAGKLPEDEEMLVAAGFAAFNQIYGEIRGRSEAAGYLL